MIMAVGTWPDGRTFIVFDAHEAGQLQRICWTPKPAEEKMLRQILEAMSR